MKRLHSACDIAPSSAAKVLFGSKADSIRSRTIWEKIKTKEQCLAIIEDQPKVCWLCGNDIDSNLSRYDPFAIQCEHILPVMQAVIFLQLYSREHADNITDAMKLEYAWAHATCNRIKTNKVFIIETNDGNYSVNTKEIENVIEEIKQITTVKDNQQTQIENKIKLIVEYLNREPGSANLKLLAGVIDCLEEVRPSVRTKLSYGGRNKTFKRKHNGRSVRKATVRSNVSVTRTYRKVRASNRKRT